MMSVYLVEERDNPSSEFFVIPFLEAHQVRIKRFSHLDLLPKFIPDNTAIVFVRYIPSGWKRLLSQPQCSGVKVFFFMDDDLFDWKVAQGAPLKYRLKLFKQAYLHQKWLKQVKAEIWISTPFLAEKYAGLKPKLISPQVPSEVKEVIKVFYHGSASHQSEIDWLFDVMREVLLRNDQLLLEIVGGSKVNRKFRKLPRTVVIHPMSWDSYKHWLGGSDRSIGLAPLLDSPFNKARSYTKFFDITRAGAVGIYSDGEPYSLVVSDGVDGFLLPADKKLWVDKILQLADDTLMRSHVLAAAKQKLAWSNSKHQGCN